MREKLKRKIHGKNSSDGDVPTRLQMKSFAVAVLRLAISVSVFIYAVRLMIPTIGPVLVYLRILGFVGLVAVMVLLFCQLLSFLLFVLSTESPLLPWDSVYVLAIYRQFLKSPPGFLYRYSRYRALTWRRFHSVALFPLFIASLSSMVLVSVVVAEVAPVTVFPRLLLDTLVRNAIPAIVVVTALIVFLYNYLDRNTSTEALEYYLAPQLYSLALGLFAVVIVAVFSPAILEQQGEEWYNLFIVPLVVLGVSVSHLTYTTLLLPLHGGVMRLHRKLGRREAVRRQLTEERSMIASDILEEQTDPRVPSAESSIIRAKDIGLERRDVISDIDRGRIEKITDETSLTAIHVDIGDEILRTDQAIAEIQVESDSSERQIAESSLEYGVYTSTAAPWRTYHSRYDRDDLLSDSLSALQRECDVAIKTNNSSRIRYCISSHLRLLNDTLIKHGEGQIGEAAEEVLLNYENIVLTIVEQSGNPADQEWRITTAAEAVRKVRQFALDLRENSDYPDLGKKLESRLDRLATDAREAEGRIHPDQYFDV